MKGSVPTIDTFLYESKRGAVPSFDTFLHGLISEMGDGRWEIEDRRQEMESPPIRLRSLRRDEGLILRRASAMEDRAVDG